MPQEVQGGVEAVAGNTDAGHDVETNFIRQLWLEERIDIGENGTVGFVTFVISLLIPPGDFRVNASTVLELDEVPADAGIGATLFRRRLEVNGAREGYGRHERAPTDHDIRLLGRGEAGKKKNRTQEGCEQREFTQYSPLVSRWLWECTRRPDTGTGQRSSERPGLRNHVSSWNCCPGYRDLTPLEESKG